MSHKSIDRLIHGQRVNSKERTELGAPAFSVLSKDPVGEEVVISHSPEEDAQLVMDPVCGMDVIESKSVSSEMHGETYSFCSKQCKEAFDSNPDFYLHQQFQKAA